jgi:hypothetical protein
MGVPNVLTQEQFNCERLERQMVAGEIRFAKQSLNPQLLDKAALREGKFGLIAVYVTGFLVIAFIAGLQALISWLFWYAGLNAGWGYIVAVAVGLVGAASLIHSIGKGGKGARVLLTTLDGRKFEEQYDDQHIAQERCGTINEQILEAHRVQIVMGDNFQNISNSTIVNHSTVEGSFKSLKSRGQDDVAHAIERLAAIVEKSKNAEAAELFNVFAEEVAKPAPKKTLLKTIWAGLIAALPGVAQMTDIAGKIVTLWK